MKVIKLALHTGRLHSQEIFLAPALLQAESTPVPQWGRKECANTKNSNNTIGNRIRDLPVCSAVPQPNDHFNSRTAGNDFYGFTGVRWFNLFMLLFIWCDFLFKVNKGIRGAAQVTAVALQQNRSSEGKNSILHLHFSPSVALYETQSRPKYFVAWKHHLYTVECHVRHVQGSAYQSEGTLKVAGQDSQASLEQLWRMQWYTCRGYDVFQQVV